jgi:hypothetical protein
MKKLAALTLSLLLLSGPAFADTPKDADAQPAKPTQPAKPKAASKTDKSDAAIAAQLEELREALQSQQEQLQLLKEELAKRDRQIDEAREAAAAANARAAEASTKATEAVNTSAEVKTTAASLNTTVADIKASNDTLKTAVAEQAAVSGTSEEGPATIHIKGINITPGGFIAAETVYRNKATSSDVNTNLNGIPFSGSGLSKVSEFNASGRQTRVTLLIDTKVGDTKVTGYEEADFLSAAATSNSRESNSFSLRQRQLWAQAALANGFTFTGGQMWSLVTETRKGIQNRQEALPMTIDAQYNIGFSWARQYGFRIVKNFGDKFALGLSVEQAQDTNLGGRGQLTQFFFNQATPSGGGLLNSSDTTGSTFNATPDFVVKAAFDPGWGHYEVFGLVRTFRDRVFPCTNATIALANLPAFCGGSATSTGGAFNDIRTGGGVGANLRVPLFNKKLDAGFHILAGDGIGRYGSGQLSDFTVRPDGTIAPIRGGQLLGTLEFHPNKKLDIYLNAGGEYEYRTAYVAINNKGVAVPVGYGSPFFNNSGCTTETGLPGVGGLTPSASGTCNGDVRNLIEGTIGFWHKFYQGPKGQIRWGLQYSYIVKNAWSANNTAPSAAVQPAGLSPNGIDNMVFTSFRYYLP